MTQEKKLKLTMNDVCAMCTAERVTIGGGYLLICPVTHLPCKMYKNRFLAGITEQMLEDEMVFDSYSYTDPCIDLCTHISSVMNAKKKNMARLISENDNSILDDITMEQITDIDINLCKRAKAIYDNADSETYGYIVNIIDLAFNN